MEHGLKSRRSVVVALTFNRNLDNVTRKDSTQITPVHIHVHPHVKTVQCILWHVKNMCTSNSDCKRVQESCYQKCNYKHTSITLSFVM